MKRRSTCILIALLVACTQLWAIGFGYHVIEARGEMEFSSGIFPVSVDYQFNFPMPDFITGSSTVFAFRLDNGLDFRTLGQNPDDGSFYALTGADHPLDYMTIYDEFNLFFTQGFWDDHIGLTLAITGRFEHAYETLNFMIDGNDDGLFWDEAGNYRFDDSSFIGVPEFRGDRKVFQSYVSGGFSLDFLDEDIVTRDGMKFESFFRITGPWMPLNDGTANFFISSNDLDLAVTMFSLDRGNGKHWMSVVLDNRTTFRYAAGTKVPQYIMDGVVWDDVAMPATSSVVTNRTSLTWYGPQLTVDTYPAVSVFYNVGLAFGDALNSDSDERYWEFAAVYGIQAEIMILDIAKFYWQWGFVTNPVFNEECRAISRIGFTFGV